MAKGGSSVGTDVMFALGAFAATIVARRAVNVLWVAATGKHAPDDPSDPKVSTAEAVAFAVATGVAVGVVRLLVQRKGSQIKARRAGPVAATT